MRKDAVVLEIREKTAVVLAPDGRFLRVRNQNYHAGQRIAEAEQTPAKIRPMLRRTLLIAACFVLVLVSSALAAGKYMIWSYAGVDVNGVSVNYALNYHNEVLSVEGNSAEAEQLIGFLESIPYEPVDSAVERMMAAAGKKHAEESEEPEVVICVASFIGGTERTEERIMEGVDRSMEKSRQDEHRETRQEDVRVERIEWRDVGQFMEDRHHPQDIQDPSDMVEELQQPEEAKPEPAEKQPVSQPTNAPQETQLTPAESGEQPAENPSEKPENPMQEPDTSGQAQHGHQNIPPDADHSAGKPAETENEPNPVQESSAFEYLNSDPPQPASQDSPRQQPAVNTPQSSQPQFQQQKTSGSDNAQMNPSGQNRPDTGVNPSDKH